MAGAGCLLALADMPYGFYVVLRFVMVSASVAAIWHIACTEKEGWPKTLALVGFGLLGAIFNPIVSIELEREQWAWFNVIGAGMMAWKLFVWSSPRPWLRAAGKFWNEIKWGVFVVGIFSATVFGVACFNKWPNQTTVIVAMLILCLLSSGIGCGVGWVKSKMQERKYKRLSEILARHIEREDIEQGDGFR